MNFDKMMKLDEMTLLLRVAQTGSMTLAARQLNMTPAAVSATIKRVEESLGVRIFERTTRSVQPTDEGVVVLEGCQRIVALWQQTIEEACGAKHELVGTVHVSAPADTTYQLVAPVVAALAQAHSRLQIVVHSSDVVHHLHRDALDMAIRYGSLHDSTLTARRLAQWPGVLVASPSYLQRQGQPRTPDDLYGHRALTLQLSSVPITTWTLFHDTGACEVSLQSLLCGDGFLARRWAVDGMGIALKSLFDVIDDLEAGRLVQVLTSYTSGPVPIHAMFPSHQHMPARVRALDAALTLAFDARSERCAQWLLRAKADDI